MKTGTGQGCTNFDEQVFIINHRCDPAGVLQMITDIVNKRIKQQGLRESIAHILIQVEIETDLKWHVANWVRKNGEVYSREKPDKEIREIEIAEQIVEHKKHVEQHEVVVIRGLDKVVRTGGLTLLHIHAISGDVDKCEKLINQGATPDVKDNYGLTPLDRAKMKGHQDVCEYLSSVMC